MIHTISSALLWGIHALVGTENPRQEASILLAYVLGCERIVLITWPEKSVSSVQMAEYHKVIARRQKQEPIAYITGTKEFWSYDFQVTRDTLIPRPETEDLIQIVLDRVPKVPLTLVDVGTGSGVIACVLSLTVPEWNVWATDISEKALKIAKKNAKNLGAHSISFVQADTLQCFPTHSVDVIVSNPPYIAATDLHLSALSFEPWNALVSGKTGMECYEEIVPQGKRVLKPGGIIILEHGFSQQKDLQLLLEKSGFLDVEGFLDVAGQPRIIIGYL